MPDKDTYPQDHSLIVRRLTSARWVAACSCGWQDTAMTHYPRLVPSDWKLHHIDKLPETRGL